MRDWLSETVDSVAVLSDIHGVLPVLDAVLAEPEVADADLVVVTGDHRILAIEINLAAAVGDRDVRHLRWLAERVGADPLGAVVITTGTDAYRRSLLAATLAG